LALLINILSIPVWVYKTIYAGFWFNLLFKLIKKAKSGFTLLKKTI